MREKDMESLPDDLRALYGSRGMRFKNDQKRRTFSLNILYINGEELLAATERLHDPDVGAALLDGASREAGDQAHREFKRHLHNFVASAMTLVDHTRVMMKERYGDESVHAEIISQISNTVAKSPTCKFVQDMRNYIVHRGLPNSQIYKSFVNTGNDVFELKVGVQIPTSDLLDYKSWTAPAKAYIEQAGDYIDIRDLVADYLAQIRKLNEWLKLRLEDYHAADLLELEGLESQQRLRYSEVDSRKSESEGKTPEGSIRDRVDAIVMDIYSSIKKHLLPQSSDKEFNSQRPALHIFDDGSGADLFIYSSDEDGNQIILFIRDSEGHYGLIEQRLGQLREVLAILGTENWARQKIGIEFLSALFFSWARKSWRVEEKCSYYDFVRGEAENEIGSLDVYYPIAHFEIETAFQFGPVIITPITGDIFDSIEGGIALPLGQELDSFKAHIQTLRKSVQGLAAVEINIEAHHSVITESGYAMAYDAVDILRFFSPTAPISDSRCPMALKGSEFLPVKNVFAFVKNGFMRHEGLSEMFRGSWKLSESGLKNMALNELSAASGLIDLSGLNSFSRSVRSGVILFSKGSTLTGTADRLRYTLVAAESVYLRHSFEYAGSLISQRISDLVSADPSERKIIKESIAKSYFLRNEYKENYSSAELTAIRMCTIAVHTALRISLLNTHNFSNRDDFIDALSNPTSH